MTDRKKPSLPPEIYKALHEFVRERDDETSRRIELPIVNRQRRHSDRLLSVESKAAVMPSLVERVIRLENDLDDLADRVDELRLARAWAMGAFATLGAAASYLVQQLLGQ